MGAVQKRLVQLGIAIQSAKGVAAAAPVHVVGLTQGKVYDVELEEQDLDTTWDNRVLAGHDRLGGMPVTDATSVVMPESIGTLLRAALGAVLTTGAGPYVHTFTTANTLPYVTLWGRYGSDSARIVDAKVDELEIAWERSGAATVKYKIMGCTFDASIAFPTPGVGVPETVVDGVLKAFGGTFTIDSVTSRVTGGSIKISNSLTPINPCNLAVPEDMFEGNVVIETNLKVIPEDLTSWRKVITGSTSGSAVSPNPLYGALELGFTGPSTVTLTAEVPKMRISTSMPDAEAGGGPAELSVVGTVVIPSTGSPVEVVLTNSVATY